MVSDLGNHFGKRVELTLQNSVRFGNRALVHLESLSSAGSPRSEVADRASQQLLTSSGDPPLVVSAIQLSIDEAPLWREEERKKFFTL